MAFQPKEPIHMSALPMNSPVPRCNQSSSSDNGSTIVVNGTESVTGDDAGSNQNWYTGSMDLNTEAVATGWMYVPLSQETAQMALDAVRYRRNYVRGVTSRLCLHYINSIRKRIGTDSIVSYLYSVDGCVSSEIVASGRCDIYSCRPYTYEVQLAQKVVKSDVFIVQSIYKTFTQKTLIELQEDSNLDFSTAPQGSWSPEMTPAKQEDALYQFEQSKAWADGFEPEQSASIGNNDQKPRIDDAKSMATTNNYLRAWDSTMTKGVSTQPVSLHTKHISMAESPLEHPSGAYGPVYVPIIGISAVAATAIAFAVAVVVTRWRVRRNAAERALSHRYPPLRNTLNTTENTISATSRESMSAGAKSTCKQVDLLGGA